MAEKKKKSEEKIKFKHLLSPTKIGPIELKNRVVLSPMNELMGGADGVVTEQQISYYAARAKGGAALIITGAIVATEMTKDFVYGRNLHLYKTDHMQGLCLFTERLHYFGAKVSAQMIMGLGRQGHTDDHSRVAPSVTAGLPYEMSPEFGSKHMVDVFKASETAREFLTGQDTREMSIAEIHSEQKEYARSCQLAVSSGFDAIEIHACHGYLLHTFLSPRTNKRTDMYGGSWRNRKRILVEIAEQVRYACPGVAVGVRISAEEHFEGGLTEEDMTDVAQEMERIGLDFINLSDGGGYEDGSLIPPIKMAKHLPEHGEAFKKAVNIPVMIASQHDPVKANENIGAAKFDIQSLGRQLFVDPEYANKLMEGRHKEIVRCTRCDTCLTRTLIGNSAACPNNPWLGREYASDEYKIGKWQEHESLIHEGLMRAPVPTLNRPWWKKEVPMTAIPRKLRGRAAKK